MFAGFSIHAVVPAAYPRVTSISGASLPIQLEDLSTTSTIAPLSRPGSETAAHREVSDPRRSTQLPGNGLPLLFDDGNQVADYFAGFILGKMVVRSAQ